MDIRSFRRQTKPEWVSPGPDYGDVEILCRPLGFDYIDEQARLLRVAARKAGGEDRISSADRAALNVEAMIKTGLVDVRGLVDNGNPVTFTQFCDLLRQPEFGELANLAMAACGAAGRVRQDDMEEAAGNSGGASAST